MIRDVEHQFNLSFSGRWIKSSTLPRRHESFFSTPPQEFILQGRLRFSGSYGGAINPLPSPSLAFAFTSGTRLTAARELGGSNKSNTPGAVLRHQMSWLNGWCPLVGVRLAIRTPEPRPSRKMHISLPQEHPRALRAGHARTGSKLRWVQKAGA